ALGVAHVYRTPLHEVLRKQDKGVYRDGFVGTFDEASSANTKPVLEARPKNLMQVEITEYHGLVPKRLFNEAIKAEGEELANEFSRLSTVEALHEDDSADMVEAIVWIANRGTLLKVVRNPFVMQDRAFISFQ